MVSSAIWIKHARVSFSKRIKIAESEGRVLFEVLRKTHEYLFYSNFTRNHPSIRFNNIHINVRDNRDFNFRLQRI
jgi:hypothetical protein